jgi:hypothetical protein
VRNERMAYRLKRLAIFDRPYETPMSTLNDGGKPLKGRSSRINRRMARIAGTSRIRHETCSVKKNSLRSMPKARTKQCRVC